MFALGELAGEVTASPPSGTESDLLHFTIDDDRGRDRVMLPVFSSPDLILPALQRNPEWQSLSLLQAGGEKLLKNIGPDVNIVVNPWTRLEWEITAPSEPSHPPDRSISSETSSSETSESSDRQQ